MGTELEKLAELFKMFGDATRLSLLFELADGEACVGELAERTGLTQSAVSHQLSVLRRSRLVRVRREGKSSYYSVADEHVSIIIRTGMEHIQEQEE